MITITFRSDSTKSARRFPTPATAAAALIEGGYTVIAHGGGLFEHASFSSRYAGFGSTTSRSDQASVEHIVRDGSR